MQKVPQGATRAKKLRWKGAEKALRKQWRERKRKPWKTYEGKKHPRLKKRKKGCGIFRVFT